MIVKIFANISSLSPAAWDRLTPPNFPFTDYAYLQALESSGCVGKRTGWHPRYLTLWQDEQMIAASFLYVKEHSQGEYIFDWAWADAYQRYGVPYFPKLSSAVPFTPATGPKFLIAPGIAEQPAAKMLIAAAQQLMQDEQHTSLHYLFLAPQELSCFDGPDFLLRHSFQYHWRNRNYAHFDDFLASLKPKRRKQIIRERQQLRVEDIQVELLTGDDLAPEHAGIFFQFYRSTIEKMRAIPYLNRDFFEMVFATMRHRILLLLAKQQGTAIAGALFYRKGDHLYGRYWGASQGVRNLHFELCYYRAIEWAIGNGIQLFEAGAQGEHKIARGFLPELTYSAHRIAHPQFRTAIAGYIEDEKREIAKIFEAIAPHHPYL